MPRNVDLDISLPGGSCPNSVNSEGVSSDQFSAPAVQMLNESPYMYPL